MTGCGTTGTSFEVHVGDRYECAFRLLGETMGADFGGLAVSGSSPYSSRCGCRHPARAARRQPAGVAESAWSGSRGRTLGRLGLPDLDRRKVAQVLAPLRGC